MDRRIEATTRLCRVLADPTRLRILALLGDGDVCVCDIHRSLRISQPKASRHLAQLRRAGLVAARRAGLWVHYRRVVPAETVAAGVVEAVLATLPQSEAVRRDAGVLARTIGCVPPGTIVRSTGRARALPLIP